MKKATIAAAVGGIPEMIEDGKTGLLFKACDCEELSEKMLALSKDKALRETLGNNFYEKAKADFSDKKMSETHKNIYLDILKKEQHCLEFKAHLCQILIVLYLLMGCLFNKLFP